MSPNKDKQFPPGPGLRCHSLQFYGWLLKAGDIRAITVGCRRCPTSCTGDTVGWWDLRPSLYPPAKECSCRHSCERLRHVASPHKRCTAGGRPRALSSVSTPLKAGSMWTSALQEGEPLKPHKCRDSALDVQFKTAPQTQFQSKVHIRVSEFHKWYCCKHLHLWEVFSNLGVSLSSCVI